MESRAWTAIAPIFNFRAETAATVPVTPEIFLRRLTLDDQGGDDPNSLFRFMLRQVDLTPSEIRPTWVISGEWSQLPTGQSVDTGKVFEQFQRVVYALHLLHNEMVAYPFLMNGFGTPPKYSMGGSGFLFPSNQAWQRAIRAPYILGVNEVDDVARLTQLILRAIARDPSGAASLALARLDATHYRADDADRVVDSAIAMEAVLSRYARDELSYRQALRGTHLLGGSPGDRSATFRLLKLAYTRRSKIVHGGHDPNDPPTDAIVDVTRRIVRKFIEATSDIEHRELIEQLDGAAISVPTTPSG